MTTKLSQLLRRAAERGLPQGSNYYFHEGEYCAIGAMVHEYLVEAGLSEEEIVERKDEFDIFVNRLPESPNRVVVENPSDMEDAFWRHEISLWALVTRRNDGAFGCMPRSFEEIADELEALGH